MCSQPGEDPFTRMEKEKKERVRNNKKQQAENLKEAVAKGGTAALPPTLKLAAVLTSQGQGNKPTKRKEFKNDVSGLYGGWWWRLGSVGCWLPK